MRKSLVALDTNHWKEALFRTDALKEIRGASSLLDRLNRVTMVEIAAEFSAHPVYAYGGAGLFLLDEDKAEVFGKSVQKAFLDSSGSGSSVCYAVQRLPVDGSESVEMLMTYDFSRELELIRYALGEEKGHPRKTLSLPAHPFMRLCDACGLDYAEVEEDDRGRMHLFCASCKERHDEDERVKEHIEDTIKTLREQRRRRADAPSDTARPIIEKHPQTSLWGRILSSLEQTEYKHVFDMSQQIPERPGDFTTYRHFLHSKEYLGVIYADANNTGAKIEALTKLAEIKALAASIDHAMHAATCAAIASKLPISSLSGDQTGNAALFPFDVLLLGGDDVIMVTEASRTLDVALTLAQEFRVYMGNKHSLSIGVVFAPVNYPFGLLMGLVESTLQFAKKRSAEIRRSAPDLDDTSINFMVAGDSLSGFQALYDRTYHRIDKDTEFYATLRPYTPDELQHLLRTIRTGKRLNLGRSKLHQLREAVIKMNLTQSVSDGLAILRNWQEVQRRFVVSHVYQFGGLYQMPDSDTRDPIKGFPRVTFPWFTDTTLRKQGEKERTIYRTALLDFVELHDFVSVEGEEIGGEN